MYRPDPARSSFPCRAFTLIELLVKVPVGPVKVIVTTPGRSSGRLPKKKGGEAITVIPIPAKYGSADASGLTYTVQPGPNEYNIDLQ